MSKSLKRVEQHLRSLGLQPDIRLMDETTRSALDAAKSVGVEVDQIVKSVVLRQGETELALLFLTAGSHQVDLAKAEQLVGSSVGMADAGFIRAKTGFAIGGVSPFGHLNELRTFLDPALLRFDKVWAAAGTPRHVFEMTPQRLADLTNAKVVDFC